MIKLDLAGEWLLSQDGNAPIRGKLPGCTYLDYMANGMDNPFYGENETKANELAHHNYCYSREFELPCEIVNEQKIELVADGLDTLCTVYVNGQAVANTDNINRVWRIDIKNVCKEGKNTIAVNFDDPYKAIEERQKLNPLPMAKTPIPGVGQLRKTPCHFGWDWGPKLPPAGVARSISIEAYSLKIDDFKVVQKHEGGKVELSVTACLSSTGTGIGPAQGVLTICGPDNSQSVYTASTDNDGKLLWSIVIEKPQLWWCNGLGGQPLYEIALSVLVNGVEAHSLKRKIGLRTIELDTSPDTYGRQFRFIVNGVPIFAKGADWIPPDSFITRADRETMFFYISAAKTANMNMLRVWGGGMYENEDFYDACDENGILVWQDFIFACNGYPLDKQEYLENVHAEVEDNVRRIRHRASLALWCGNNENEVALLLLRYEKLPEVLKINMQFYHKTLREWVNELDGVTSYWPGSPSSGSLDRRVHSMKNGKTWGDTHLWQVWHGMQPIEAFRNYPTRFCSEFGMESMPSMHAIKTFTDNPSPKLFDPVMQLHQKSGGGNEKILFYLLAKYRNPAKFEDYIYLSQIVQGNTVRFATDCWRRNIGMQNGSIFWQLNDCWPVASWAGIDYEKQLKAVMYMAKHFNKQLCISNNYFADRAELYIVNEYPSAFSGRLEWELQSFTGKVIQKGVKPVKLNSVSSLNACVLKFADILSGIKKSDASLIARLYSDNGELMDEKYWLLVPDKKANLPKVKVKSKCSVSDNTATVTLTSEKYARYVYIEAEGINNPWSDNYFDIPAGRSVTVSVKLSEKMDKDELEKRLKIKTLTDVEPANGLFKDKLLRLKMVFKNKNYITWIVFKIILR